MRLAAVTGGTGTVGSATIANLIEHGWAVRALARSEAAAESLPGEVEVVRGDVRNPGDLDRLVDGADTVFHIAGVNALCVADRQDMWATNVEAPGLVHASAVSAGVRRLVHVSSAAAEGQRTSYYAETKWEADRMLRQLSGQHDLELVLVAPTSVQGPGRVSGTGKLILDLVAGRLKYMIDTVVSIVDISDCATAIRLAADGPPGDERLVVSGFTMSTRQALDLLESQIGRPIPVHFLPGALVGSLARFGPMLGPIGRMAGIDLCPEMIRTMSVDHRHDGSAAARTLGFTYRPAVETFDRLIAWAVTTGMM